MRWIFFNEAASMRRYQVLASGGEESSTVRWQGEGERSLIWGGVQLGASGSSSEPWRGSPALPFTSRLIPLWSCLSITPLREPSCARTVLPKALLPLSPLNLPLPWGCTQIAHIKKQIDYELSFVYQQFLICNLVMSERKSLIIQ